MPTKRLTDQFVERVKPPAKGRVEYFDAAFPALSLRVTETGHKSFSVFYRMNGDPKLRRHTLGTHLKPARARLLATAVLDRARAGIDPNAVKRQARQDAPVDVDSIDALVRDYLRQHIEPNCSAGTYVNAKRMLEIDILKPWRGRKLDNISKRDAIVLIDRIAEDRPVHANRVLARLRAMFNWAVGIGSPLRRLTASGRRPKKRAAIVGSMNRRLSGFGAPANRSVIHSDRCFRRCC